MSDRFLNIHDVCEKIRFSRDAVYKMIARGEFPKQIPVGSKSVRWRESDINNWMNDKAENSGEKQYRGN